MEKQKHPDIIIGGLAAGLIGEARLTQDIDILIAISQEGVGDFLKQAIKCGFTFSSRKQIVEDVDLRGVFSLKRGEFHVDFILGNMPFEEEAFSRRQKIKLFNRTAYFPTPEDLILFKLIASRPKDLLDIQAIVLRHKQKLDQDYLKKWARIISDDLDDVQIYQKLEKLLKD